MKLVTERTELRISAGFPKQFPRDPIPQIAFSGRSNVGKSSLINTILGRNSLARVSSTPGKTVTVNFYEVDRKLFFVDLPGYGYARRSEESKKVWSSLTDGYFTKNPNRDLLRLVVQLVDSRIGPTADDLMMIDWMRGAGVRFVIVATKTDKLNKTQLAKASEELTAFSNSVTDIPPIFFSSVTKNGKTALWNTIFSAIESEI
jgi:GTP-binding protein